MVKSVVIDAKNLVKKYGNKSVVDGVHFEVFGGECYGILGPNGAGKTSTMRMIYCSTSVSAGQLNVLGLDVKDHQSEIKSKLGIVPQHDGLDPDFSVRENLELYCGYHGILKKDSKEKIDGLLRDLDLTEHQTKKVDELSGGLRRRVVIARSLVNDPEIVILDEPTTGLDPQARLWIWEKLKRYKKSGKTLILTTHYMEEAEKLCDRVVVMDHGKFLAEGTPADLIRKYVGHEV
ncbi:MAG: ABC transporter ATP-binding protein, partial [Bdellovibrionales bacterium]|nr:ABC transporter ATP-binding protein [Bdellovibrionales bacterium]